MKTAIAIAAIVLICLCVLAALNNIATSKCINDAIHNGIRFKDANALKNAAGMDILALDMAGKITNEEPVVTDVFTAEHFSSSGYSISGLSEDELLETAALLEAESNNPIAKAIIKYTNDLVMESIEEITNIKEMSGSGLEGEVDGIILRSGNLKFIERFVNVPSEAKMRAKELEDAGKSLVFFSKGQRFLGIIAVSYSVKSDIARAIEEIENQGIHVVMLSELEEATARAIGNKAGIDEVIASLLPSEKDGEISKLSQRGKVSTTIEQVEGAEDLSVEDMAKAISLSRKLRKNIRNSILGVAMVLVAGILFIVLLTT